MKVSASSGCLTRLLALLIFAPLAELVVLLLLAHYTNILTALLAVIVTGVAGSLLIRAQGWRTMRRITEDLQQGRLPTDALLDAAIIFGAGVLLLTPGLLTDVVALVLLIPVCRRRARQLLVAWMRRHMHIDAWPGAAPPGGRSEIVDAHVIEPPEDDRG
jgi:UPF0716 protein FxsA